VRTPYTQIYMHLVWATWDRLPLLTPEIRDAVYACMQAECQRLRVHVVAIGGIEDHVHLLVMMPPTLSVSYMVQQIKGVSSHLINHDIAKPFAFKWQGGYGAFSVSKRMLPRARDYVLHQEVHHRLGNLSPAVEPGGTDQAT